MSANFAITMTVLAGLIGLVVGIMIGKAGSDNWPEDRR